jgi:hypothetical protein
MYKTLAILLSLTVLATIACNEDESSGDGTRGRRRPASAPLRRVLTETPLEDPIGLARAQQVAAPGETITVQGFVGGIVDPLPEGMAILTMIDTQVPLSCGTRPNDHCPTPWDYCCEPIENRKRAMASVQVLDDQGRAYPESLRRLDGLTPFAQIAVRGTVRDVQPGQRLILDAEKIHVISPAPPE